MTGSTTTGTDNTCSAPVEEQVMKSGHQKRMAAGITVLWWNAKRSPFAAPLGGLPVQCRSIAEVDREGLRMAFRTDMR